jgi:anti-sigma regulatory factor (Ser/Thr protein kinase)
MAAALHLAVANELSAIEPARVQVHDFVAPHRLSARLVYQLELVLEEALMNRLLHAFPGGGRHRTDVHLQVTPDALVLCFEDDGIAFDPGQRPPAQAPASLPEAHPGGLGLQLIRKAASSLHYERVNERNRFTVWLARG